MKVIVIVGPTASGKTDLSIKLALYLKNTEIISADSKQVYQGLDLGTGKITEKEKQGIPHYLLDVTSPKKRFTVVQYQKKARKTLEKIIKRKNIPIVVGGTGFYVQALIDGLIIPEVSPDFKLRKKLEKEKDLFKKLKKLDPKRAETIDKDNPRRLIRAIEIVLKTGKPVPKLKKDPLPYPVLKLGIKNDQLEKRIKKRLKKRIKQGMIKEVKGLKKQISHKKLKELGIEYKYISQYLEGKINYQKMQDLIIKESKDYARRQMTWFKRDKEIIWIKNWREAKKEVKNFL